jgi:hypothetical protein
MYFHDDAPNITSFIAALKAGNSGGVVAFNRGPAAQVKPFCEGEDYTAGETSEGLPLSVEVKDNSTCDSQFHVLVFARESWGRGAPRFAADFVRAYTHLINSRGGAVSWDIPISEHGEIPAAVLQLVGSIDRGSSEREYKPGGVACGQPRGTSGALMSEGMSRSIRQAI